MVTLAANHSNRTITISTCTSSVAMLNDGKELTDHEYIPLCVLNTFFALTAIVLNSVTMRAIRKITSAVLPKKCESTVVEFGFF